VSFSEYTVYMRTLVEIAKFPTKPKFNPPQFSYNVWQEKARAGGVNYISPF